MMAMGLAALLARLAVRKPFAAARRSASGLASISACHA